ncbi:MAG TPA: MFS transporter [Terriglobia bacterium]|nr:MFS transporter [Terriglobia bacterium]
MIKSISQEPAQTRGSKKRWTRIIPLTLVMYTIAFIDRTNISMGLPSISRDLHLSPTQAGAVAGVFFWGYLLLQVPGGHFASRWSSKRLIAILLLLWGLCAIGCGLTTSWRELWTMRFLLGVAEGGVWPSTLILLSNWFPRAERARANAWFMLCIPLSVIIASPISGWILSRWDWRVMLIAEGSLPILWLVVWLRKIDDRPAKAAWLSKEERDDLEGLLAEEREEVEKLKPQPYLKALFEPQVMVMVMMYFLFSVASTGYLFWLPTVLESARKMGDLFVGILMAIPFIVTGIMMVLNSWHSDISGERRGHVAAAVGSAGVFLLLAVWASHFSQLLAYIFLCLAAGGPYVALGPFWAIATETLPHKTLGAAMGLITGLGNLGGYFGPLWVGYLNQHSGNFVGGFSLMGICFLVASSLTLLLRSSSAVRPLQKIRWTRGC